MKIIYRNFKNNSFNKQFQLFIVNVCKVPIESKIKPTQFGHPQLSVSKYVSPDKEEDMMAAKLRDLLIFIEEVSKKEQFSPWL